MFYCSSLPLSEASPFANTVHVYINRASEGCYNWKSSETNHTCPTPEKIRKKHSLKPWTWCQVNGYGYIKLYHILHGFPYAPMGISRTQPHMPTQQGFPKKCPHLQLRALFRQKVHNWWRKTWGPIFEFSVVQKASKVFLVSEFPAIKTPKDLLTQDQETCCCFFFVSLWYVSKKN